MELWRSYFNIESDVVRAEGTLPDRYPLLTLRCSLSRFTWLLINTSVNDRLANVDASVEHCRAYLASCFSALAFWNGADTYAKVAAAFPDGPSSSGIAKEYADRVIEMHKISDGLTEEYYSEIDDAFGDKGILNVATEFAASSKRGERVERARKLMYRAYSDIPVAVAMLQALDKQPTPSTFDLATRWAKQNVLLEWASVLDYARATLGDGWEQIFADGKVEEDRGISFAQDEEEMEMAIMRLLPPMLQRDEASFVAKLTVSGPVPYPNKVAEYGTALRCIAHPPFELFALETHGKRMGEKYAKSLGNFLESLRTAILDALKIQTPPVALSCAPHGAIPIARKEIDCKADASACGDAECGDGQGALAYAARMFTNEDGTKFFVSPGAYDRRIEKLNWELLHCDDADVAKLRKEMTEHVEGMRKCVIDLETCKSARESCERKLTKAFGTADVDESVITKYQRYSRLLPDLQKRIGTLERENELMRSMLASISKQEAKVSGERADVTSAVVQKLSDQLDGLARKIEGSKCVPSSVHEETLRLLDSKTKELERLQKELESSKEVSRVCFSDVEARTESARREFKSDIADRVSSVSDKLEDANRQAAMLSEAFKKI